MMSESGPGPQVTESPGGKGEWTKGQHSTTLQKMTKKASGGPNHLFQRHARGAEWTSKKVTVVVDSGAVENVMPRNMFPDISTEETERSQNGKGFKGFGGEHIKNYGQQVMCVTALEGFVRKSSCKVADGRRLLVSASHTVQARNDLFI